MEMGDLGVHRRKNPWPPSAVPFAGPFVASGFLSGRIGNIPKGQTGKGQQWVIRIVYTEGQGKGPNSFLGMASFP